MVLTAGADFLNRVFAGFDMLFLSFYHSVCCKPLTFIFKLITLIGEKGLIFFLASILLMCFARTRKTGICLFGAVCCGALITTIILKDMIARPRPLESEPFRGWFLAMGAPAEDDFSFPSGHVTAAAAGMLALRLREGKKWTIPAVVWVALMCAARNYLMAHYPSDVLAGAVVGTISAVTAWYITELIYRILRTNRNKSWAGFILGWNVPDVAGIPSRLGLIDARSGKDPADLKARKAKIRSPRAAGKSSSGYAGKHVR